MARQRTSGRAAGFVEHLEERRLLSDVVPVGPEFRVNTYTTSDQREASIAMDADGDFVIAWFSNGQDGSSFGCFAQRYNAAGAPQGGEFRVNTYTTNSQFAPAVAADSDGDFIIAWHSAYQDGSTNGVYAQRYNSTGSPQGGEFRVNTYTTNNQAAASVAMDADGDFVIAWSGAGLDDDGVFAQRYNAAGVPQAGEFRVNTYTTNIQRNPSVAMDADGDFVIAWRGQGEDDTSGVFAQLFTASGVPQGTEFRVNTFTTGNQGGPGHLTAAMDADGDFVIAWTSYGGQDESSEGVFAQRYNAAGVPQGGEFRVNTYTTGPQFVPSVAMDAIGNFVVAWGGQAPDNVRDVYAQRYDASGVPVGVEFRVNTYTPNRQTFPAIGMDPAGDFVVAWNDGDISVPGGNGQDGSGYGIYAQRYAVVPEVTASSFHFATAPHNLSFTFTRDVSGSLAVDDLVVENLRTMQTIPSSDFSISYDSPTNVATFTYTGTTAGIVGMLPDGNYTATLIASGVTTIQGAPLASDYVHNFQFLQADADHDGRVNLQDFNILAANFGQSPRDFTQGDFNYTGNVNLDDFNILAARFGAVLAQPDGKSLFRSGSSIDREGLIEELLA